MPRQHRFASEWKLTQIRSVLPRRRCIWLPLLVIIIILSPLLTSSAAHGQTNITSRSLVLPPGFAVTRIAEGLTRPVDMAFAPDGDILVAEKGTGADETATAHVRLIRNGALQAAPVLALSVNAYWDSGLQSIALDPDFATNGFFYLWYNTGSAATGWSGTTVTRLSRFTFDAASGRADPASEVIQIDGVPWGKWHHGGGLAFDEAGYLYVATGDAVDEANAQDLSSLNGKLLRIRPGDGGAQIPADNPFREVEGALPEIFALGLRNPYRLTRHPTSGALYLGDVGDIAWEEVNRVIVGSDAVGANYGWPLREGPCPKGQHLPCAAASAEYTEPAVAYAHPTENWRDSNSVTGLTFWDGAQESPSLVLADYNEQVLRLAEETADGAYTLALFAEETGRIVDLETHAGGLYTLDLVAGTISLIYATGVDNQAPVAQLTVDQTWGASPLLVAFSAAGTRDGDDLSLTYRWDFGDGHQAESSAPAVEHVYAADGTYQATLEVVDARGARSAPVEQTVTVYSGTWPEIVLENETEPGRARFHGGDAVRYRVRYAGDAVALAVENPFAWRVDFHHNQHVHPIVTGELGETNLLHVPVDNHDGSANVWFQFHLTMTAADGQPVAVSRNLRPRLVRLTVDAAGAATEPTAAMVDGVKHALPYTAAAIAGTMYTIETAAHRLSGERIEAFDRWTLPVDALVHGTVSDRQITVALPAETARFTAHYVDERAAERVLLPLVFQ